jgi:hypothetical protein
VWACRSCSLLNHSLALHAHCPRCHTCQVTSIRCAGYDHEVVLEGLVPDTVYAYHVLTGEEGPPLSLGTASSIHRFRTPPVTGQGSTFTSARLWVIGDSGRNMLGD